MHPTSKDQHHNQNNGHRNDNDDNDDVYCEYDNLEQGLDGDDDNDRNITTTFGSFQFRPIQPQDRLRIQQLHEEWFPVRYHEEFYDDLCSSSHNDNNYNNGDGDETSHNNVEAKTANNLGLLTRVVVFRPEEEPLLPSLLPTATTTITSTNLVPTIITNENINDTNYNSKKNESFFFASCENFTVHPDHFDADHDNHCDANNNISNHHNMMTTMTGRNNNNNMRNDDFAIFSSAATTTTNGTGINNHVSSLMPSTQLLPPPSSPQYHLQSMYSLADQQEHFNSISNDNNNNSTTMSNDGGGFFWDPSAGTTCLLLEDYNDCSIRQTKQRQQQQQQQAQPYQQTQPPLEQQPPIEQQQQQTSPPLQQPPPPLTAVSSLSSEQIVACLVGCFLTIPHPATLREFSEHDDDDDQEDDNMDEEQALTRTEEPMSSTSSSCCKPPQQEQEQDENHYYHNDTHEATSSTTTTPHHQDETESPDKHDNHNTNRNQYHGLVNAETARLLLSNPTLHDTLFYIMTLGTVAEYRHGGLATQLLQWLFQLIQQDHPTCGAIYLHVLTDNHAAIHLYERLGFYRVQEIPNYYTIQGAHYNCYLYAKYFHGNRGHWDWYRWLAGYVSLVWKRVKTPLAQWWWGRRYE